MNTLIFTIVQVSLNDMEAKNETFSIYGQPDSLVLGIKSLRNADFRVDCYDRKGEKYINYGFKRFSLKNLSNSPEPNLNKKICMFYHSDRFEQDFYMAKELIAQGMLEKAVIYNSLIVTLENDFNIEHSLKKLQDVSSKHYVYGLWQSNEGFLGVSPEILFENSQTSKNKYNSVSLAGTVKVGEQKKLLNDKKLNNEHSIVTRHFAHYFEENNIPYKIFSKGMEPFQNLVHLKQGIEFSYSGSDECLISSLSPTPAIGVAPRKKLNSTWNQFIFNQNKENRAYGGTFHWQDETKNDAIVMIRNIQWKNNFLKVNAGCGIVTDSDLETELAESKRKIASVMELLL